jgi:Fe2+ or Zn2+ uptake regulation protein
MILSLNSAILGGVFAEVVAAVASSGDRLTRPRAAVAAMVARRDGPFTAGELISEGRERERVGRATVFRTLELFERLGLLERLDLPDGSHAYVRCRPAAHHHHVVCVECRRAVEIPDSGLQRVTADVARSTGFVLEGHRLELFGLCPTCQAGRPSTHSLSRG